eukprot:294638-Chlamydomonas_euryale.AAC.1
MLAWAARSRQALCSALARVRRCMLFLMNHVQAHSHPSPHVGAHTHTHLAPDPNALQPSNPSTLTCPSAAKRPPPSLPPPPGISGRPLLANVWVSPPSPPLICPPVPPVSNPPFISATQTRNAPAKDALGVVFLSMIVAPRHRTLETPDAAKGGPAWMAMPLRPPPSPPLPYPLPPGLSDIASPSPAPSPLARSPLPVSLQRLSPLAWPPPSPRSSVLHDQVDGTVAMAGSTVTLAYNRKNTCLSNLQLPAGAALTLRWGYNGWQSPVVVELRRKKVGGSWVMRLDGWSCGAGNWTEAG